MNKSSWQCPCDCPVPKLFCRGVAHRGRGRGVHHDCLLTVEAPDQLGPYLRSIEATFDAR